MSAVRVLFVLSADFGEYVTANIFSRGQLFESRFAVPPRLARYCDADRGEVDAYEDVGGLRRIVAAVRPDVVVLCSGYLFIINNLSTISELTSLVGELRQNGIVVATTDPWLRVFELNPQAGFTIHSVRKGGVDTSASMQVTRLHAVLQSLFRDAPHLLAVPLPAREKNWLPFFNPDFVPAAAAGAELRRDNEWVFVLAREDYVLLAGTERNHFFDTLRNRIDELMSVAENHVTVIGPTEMQTLFDERSGHWPRVSFVQFCSFAAFEALIRRASVVVYWNLLSASLLYCLYHGVAPMFLGRGHQVKVCPALYSHVIEHVYRGRPPVLLDFEAALEPCAVQLVERHGIVRWLDEIRRDYACLPKPARIIRKIAGRHAYQ